MLLFSRRSAWVWSVSVMMSIVGGTSIVLPPAVLPAVAQTVQSRRAEAFRLNEEGQKLDQQGKLFLALEKYQQALAIVREIQDREGEGALLNNIGELYRNLGQYSKALEALKQSSAISREVEDKLGEGTALNNIGLLYFHLGFYQKAVVTLQQALATIPEEVENRFRKGRTLNNIGEVYRSLGQSSKALEALQQALIISRETGDRLGESATVSNIGLVYSSLGQYPKALESFQEALALVKEIGGTQGEGTISNNIGEVYISLGQYLKALEIFQQALAIQKKVGDRPGEGRTLTNIGAAHSRLGQYSRALETFQQALAIQEEVGDRSGESSTLTNIGGIYGRLGQYSRALETFQQALAIQEEVGNRPKKGNTLIDIGEIYNNLGQYSKALETYQRALTIQKEVGNRSGEGNALASLGAIYDSMGQYFKALEIYQKALVIIKEVGDRRGESRILSNFGAVYRNLGRYSRALETYQQALVISKDIGDRHGESMTLNNIGLVYDNLGQYDNAIEAYRKALAISKDIGDRRGEGTTLTNIASVYNSLEQYSEALETYQQALAIHKAIGYRRGEGTTLNNIGSAYDSLGKYTRALDLYQQALAISKEVGNKEGEGFTLNNIGSALKAQKKTELAIVFLKESVTIFEDIRSNLNVLPQERQSYTTRVESAYRTLADLLLTQDRVLEAQQVLDLLKVQELDLYLRNVRGGKQPLIILQSEAKILENYKEFQSSAIQIGQELTQLRSIPESSRTQQQQQRIDRLVQLEKEINTQFNQFIDRDDVKNLIQSLNSTARTQSVNLEDLNKLRSTLQKVNAVILYPLVLNDRLELIITTPNTPPIRRTVPVKKTELNAAIVQFRQALQDPTIDAKVPAQKLYEWLIKPLEADLKQAKIDSIIYSPDGQLRYIPLAALYDGQKWLTQRYKINNITARSLTDFNRPAQSQLRVLSGAFVQGSYKFEVGGSSFSFVGLPFAGKEVDQVTTLIPGGTKLVDKAFSLAAIEPKLNEYSIVHFATHGAFVPGKPEDSFLLFGNGDRPTLQDIQNWSLQNVDLVVLSACETGIGGKLGSGEEILGLGYQFQRAGARATIASLWKVDDGGTQELMSNFYAALKGKTSKSEALRVAQIALIQQGQATTGDKRASLAVVPNSNPTQTKGKLDHPYYWAPFILIGNGF